jgi:ABC-type polysaccharide/polyol phosphate export permease
LTTQPRYYAAARSSYLGEVANAGKDFTRSFRLAPMWAKFAWNDILTQYRGSVLGPMWIVLTNAAFVFGVGLVYAQVMKVDYDVYVPWIAAGVVVWNFFNLSVMQGGDTFVSQGSIIRQSSIPLPTFIGRVVLRNIFILAHQLVVVVGVALYFGFLLKINLPMVVVGFILAVLNISWIVLVLAVAAARFRDLQQAVTSILQVTFFLSPIVWLPTQNPAAARILAVNPVYHLLEVMRNPLLGLPVPLDSLIYMATAGVLGWVFAFLFYAGVRRRIVHFL